MLAILYVTLTYVRFMVVLCDVCVLFCYFISFLLATVGVMKIGLYLCIVKLFGREMLAILYVALKYCLS